MRISLLVIASLFAGLISTASIMIASAFTNGLLMQRGYLRVEDYYANFLLTSLILWFLFAGIIVFLSLEKIKINTISLVLRQLFLWGPISFAWFLTTKGIYGALPLGMCISSIVLFYQTLVWHK
jgi:hypothetical protein